MRGIELKPDAADVIMRVVYLTQDTILVIQDREEEAKFIEARQLLRQWLSDWADRKEPDQSERVSRLEEALRHIACGATHSKALFESKMRGRKSLTWNAVNELQDYLEAAQGTARAALNDGGSDAG